MATHHGINWFSLFSRSKNNPTIFLRIIYRSTINTNHFGLYGGLRYSGWLEPKATMYVFRWKSTSNSNMVQKWQEGKQIVTFISSDYFSVLFKKNIFISFRYVIRCGWFSIRGIWKEKIIKNFTRFFKPILCSTNWDWKKNTEKIENLKMICSCINFWKKKNFWSLRVKILLMKDVWEKKILENILKKDLVF